MPDTPFATVQDVEDRWRALTVDEQNVADTLIYDASDMIRIRWPSVDDRITSGALNSGSLTRVVAGMVRRAMLAGDNEGWETRNEAAGPYSLGGKLSNPNGNLYLSAEDVRLFDGSPSEKAFAFDLAPSWCFDASG